MIYAFEDCLFIKRMIDMAYASILSKELSLFRIMQQKLKAKY